MHTFFLVMAIWILMNVLFVIVMLPKARRPTDLPSGRDGHTNLPHEHDPTFGQILPAVAIGIYFMLVPIVVRTYAAIRPVRNYRDA